MSCHVPAGILADTHMNVRKADPAIMTLESVNHIMGFRENLEVTTTES